MMSVKVLFVIVAVACLFQVIAGFDWLQYLEERLQTIIKEEHLTCENYAEHCEKNIKDQFENSVDPQENEPNTTEMAIQFCKAILKPYVCKTEEKS